MVRRMARNSAFLGILALIIVAAALNDGYVQVLEGLHPGELVATEGALFLSNTAIGASRS